MKDIYDSMYMMGECKIDIRAICKGYPVKDIYDSVYMTGEIR